MLGAQGRTLSVKEATYWWFGIAAVAAASFGMVGCSSGPRTAGESSTRTEAVGEHASSEAEGEHARAEGTGEHGEGREGRDHHGPGEEGEKSGEYIGREDTWDATRKGARLILSFDPASDAFVGTVENTSRVRLCAVRVEVHLSTGTELGPTERTDLQPGEKTVVRLATGGEAFDTWTAHPEVSPCAGA